MSCLFCRIVAGEIPAELVLQEAGALAFFDIQPLADGHVVVIPRTHAERVEELATTEIAALFQTVARLTGPLRRALDADAITIGINDGPASGQTIPHVHVHLVPRREGDGAGTIHTIFKMRGRRPVAEVGAAIRKALGG